MGVGVAACVYALGGRVGVCAGVWCAGVGIMIIFIINIIIIIVIGFFQFSNFYLFWGRSNLEIFKSQYEKN